jgi:hypothetical protein
MKGNVMPRVPLGGQTILVVAMFSAVSSSTSDFRVVSLTSSNLPSPAVF